MLSLLVGGHALVSGLGLIQGDAQALLLDEHPGLRDVDVDAPSAARVQHLLLEVHPVGDVVHPEDVLEDVDPIGAGVLVLPALALPLVEELPRRFSLLNLVHRMSSFPGVVWVIPDLRHCGDAPLSLRRHPPSKLGRQGSGVAGLLRVTPGVLRALPPRLAGEGDRLRWWGSVLYTKQPPRPRVSSQRRNGRSFSLFRGTTLLPPRRAGQALDGAVSGAPRRRLSGCSRASGSPRAVRLAPPGGSLHRLKRSVPVHRGCIITNPAPLVKRFSLQRASSGRRSAGSAGPGRPRRPRSPRRRGRPAAGPPA